MATALRFGLALALLFGFAFTFALEALAFAVVILDFALVRPAVLEVPVLPAAPAAAKKRGEEVERARDVDKLDKRGKRCNLIGAADLKAKRGTRRAMDRVKDSMVAVNMVETDELYCQNSISTHRARHVQSRAGMLKYRIYRRNM